MAYTLKYWLVGEPVLPVAGSGDLSFWYIGAPLVVYEAGGTPTAFIPIIFTY